MKRYFTKNIILFTACFFLYVSQGIAQQKTLYVSTGGNNANVGTDPSLPKRTIMAAFYDAADGDIINVAAGEYVETDVIYLNRPITIKGSNAGLPANVWTNPPTIIRPKATDVTGGGNAAVIQLVTSNIVLDGIAVYGDNGLLNDGTPTTINSVAARASYGVFAFSNINGLKVLNSKFANFVQSGVRFTTSNDALISNSGNEIKNSSFDNIVRPDNNGQGVYLNNFIAEVSGNVMTKVDRGVFYETGTSVANTTPLLSINNNNISAYNHGVLMYGGGDAIIPATEIKTNTLTWQDISSLSGDGITASPNSIRGIAIERARGTATILVQNNNVTGYKDGIAALSVEKNPSNLNRLTIEGGTITNSTDNGVLVSNYINQWESRAAIRGVQVVNAANSGIFVTSSGNAYNTEAALSNGVVLQKNLPITSNYDQAIYVNGSKAILTELGNTKITNAKWNFINLNNNAMQGLEVDGTAMIFDGEVTGHGDGYVFSNFTPGLSHDNAILIALQQRVRDNNPNSFGFYANAGLIKFNLGVLPVTLTSFDAKLTNGGALLSWKTSSEKNNDHFVLARSNDGKNFIDFATVKGRGNSDTEKAYTYTDFSFASSTYYLLKQVDADGKTTAYTDLIKFVKGLESSIALYPNPTVDILNVNLGATSSDVAIYNLSGQKIKGLKKQAAGTLAVNVGDLAAGNYIIVVSSADGKKQQKFIKK